MILSPYWRNGLSNNTARVIELNDNDVKKSGFIYNEAGDPSQRRYLNCLFKKYNLEPELFQEYEELVYGHQNKILRPVTMYYIRNLGRGFLQKVKALKPRWKEAMRTKLDESVDINQKFVSAIHKFVKEAQGTKELRKTVITLLFSIIQPKFSWS